ncbi:MAG: CocE/NonD family hydrolase [Segetibacter sp.]|jgi:putative CocE/NonD family hydrolase|nr:CocE/NonD family hydrolase [Segetibacter sp.]
MKIILGFLLFLNPSLVQAQQQDSVWFSQNYSKKEVSIPMRDGVKLFTSIYYPKSNTEKHPILLTRTPYSCAPYGSDQLNPAYWNNYEKNYAKEGYILIKQDVRGRWMSEGDFVNVRPFSPVKKSGEIDESSDAYDTIDWLIKNLDNNNGNVGVFGVSYPGFFSTMAAASNHPALKAVSPQAPVTNWFIGDDFHHNGAFFQMDAFDFYSALGSGFGQPHPRPTSVPANNVGYPVHDNYKFFLQTGTVANLTKLLGDSVAFWKDLMSHPNYDAFWKARDARNATHNLKPAMLWVGGLFDAEDNWGAWNAYKAAEENNKGKDFNKLVMGPWYHGQWANNDGTHLGNVQFGSNTSTWYQQNIEIPFFNYYLKGKGDVSKIAEANIFISGANEWKNFNQWPPAEKQDKALYLHPNGKLSWTKPTNENGFSSYMSDPAKPVPYTEDVHFNRSRNYMTDDQRFASRRPDVLVFETDTLTEDVTVTGNVTADLITSITTTDADFVVKLIDVLPDYLSYNKIDIYSDKDPEINYPLGGYQMLVHGEVFRGRFRNSYEKPQPFIPNKIDEVKYKLGDVAHTFKKGHRIMLQVQSSWFPLVDRNPQTFVDIYHAKESDFKKATINIFHNAKGSSKIILPVYSNR